MEIEGDSDSDEVEEQEEYVEEQTKNKKIKKNKKKKGKLTDQDFPALSWVNTFMILKGVLKDFILILETRVS